jgi:hypothetical protein
VQLETLDLPRRGATLSIFLGAAVEGRLDAGVGRRSGRGGHGCWEAEQEGRHRRLGGRWEARLGRWEVWAAGRRAQFLQKGCHGSCKVKNQLH